MFSHDNDETFLLLCFSFMLQHSLCFVLHVVLCSRNFLLSPSFFFLLVSVNAFFDCCLKCIAMQTQNWSHLDAISMQFKSRNDEEEVKDFKQNYEKLLRQVFFLHVFQMHVQSVFFVFRLCHSEKIAFGRSLNLTSLLRTRCTMWNCNNWEMSGELFSTLHLEL